MTYAICFAVVQANHKDHVPYGWIIGGLGVGLALIAVLLVICVCLKSSSCFAKGRGSLAKDSDGKNPHKFQILRTRSYCCGSGRYSCCKSADVKQTNGESTNLQMNIPKGFFFKLFSILFGFLFLQILFICNCTVGLSLTVKEISFTVFLLVRIHTSFNKECILGTL